MSSHRQLCELPIHAYLSPPPPPSAMALLHSTAVAFLIAHARTHSYTNITVLDISAKALERVQHRLGDAGCKVKWVATNVLDFQPLEPFDYWHDRAG